MSILLHFINEELTVDAEADITLLQAQRAAGLVPDAPCGGKGTCGKCLVDIRTAQAGAWIPVKSCQTVIDRELWVRAAGRKDMHVLTHGEENDTLWEPHTQVLSLFTPSEPGYLAAFDVGTTTLAGYLMRQEGTVARAGSPNPQAQFGADVIQRADYAMKHGTRELSQCVREAVDHLLGQLCAQANIRREEVLAVSLVGNTCMHHLFLGISPASLALAPYQPAVREGLILSCAEYGVHAHPRASLFVLPVIAGFVGADTVGCLLAGDWAHREKLTLLIDIGTNGEIVLGNRHRMIACSTAAGPAFEGALISCGMRGAPGAVDHVWLEDGQIRHSVIGGGKALGICGSGLIDLAAVLLRNGDMDETGLLTEGSSFLLPGTELSLTQKDIRQLQLAKAAISAGIRLLIRHWGASPEEIEEVCVAGAFGTFMNPKSACDIGLIPRELGNRIQLKGNWAGAGAQLALRSRSAWELARAIAAKAEFLELASVADFQDAFIDELEFPELA